MVVVAGAAEPLLLLLAAAGVVAAPLVRVVWVGLLRVLEACQDRQTLPPQSPVMVRRAVHPPRLAAVPNMGALGAVGTPTSRLTPRVE